jgi:hypothetical protein
LKVEGGGFPAESERIGFANLVNLKERKTAMRDRTANDSRQKAKLTLVSRGDEEGLRACFVSAQKC